MATTTTTYTQEKKPYDDNAKDSIYPPDYADATVPTASASKSPTAYTFTRKSRLSSHLIVQSNGVDRFAFKHDTSKEPCITMHPGSSLKTPPLGYLTFSPTISAFQIHFTDTTTSTSTPTRTNVRARAGHPHPQAFTFTPPPAISSGQEYTWRHIRGWMRNPSRPQDSSFPVVYELRAGVHDAHHATLTVQKRKGHGTKVEWRIEAGSELEQAFLVLSAIGVVVRLAKGLESRLQEGSGLFYWRLGPMFWFPGAGTVWG